MQRAWGSFFFVVATVVVVACGTTPAGPAPSPSAQGAAVFAARCNRCHPGGGAGVGPAVTVLRASDVLTREASYNRHAVPDAEYDALIAYLGASFPGDPVAVAVADPVAPPTIAPPAPPTTVPPTTTITPPPPAPPAPPTTMPPTPSTPPPTTITPPPTTTITPPPPAPTTTAASSPAPAATPVDDGRGIKVIVLDLRGTTVTPAEASAIGQLVTVAAAEFEALDVASGADVRELTALEGSKELAGCDASGCFAEIAGALGARLVVYGQVDKLGSRYVCSLSLHDTKTSNARGRVALQEESLDALANAIPDAVVRLVTPFLDEEQLPTTRASTAARPVATATPPPAPPAAPSLVPSLALFGSGGVLVVGGAVAAAVGAGSFLALQDANAGLTRLRAEFEAENDAGKQRALLDDATALQADADARRAEWNGLGQALWLGGLGAVVVGAGVAAAGVIFLPAGEP